jgi:hypothetical protein
MTAVADRPFMFFMFFNHLAYYPSKQHSGFIVESWISHCVKMIKTYISDELAASSKMTVIFTISIE